MKIRYREVNKTPSIEIDCLANREGRRFHPMIRVEENKALDNVPQVVSGFSGYMSVNESTLYGEALIFASSVLEKVNQIGDLRKAWSNIKSSLAGIEGVDLTSNGVLVIS